MSSWYMPTCHKQKWARVKLELFMDHAIDELTDEAVYESLGRLI